MKRFFKRFVIGILNFLVLFSGSAYGQCDIICAASDNKLWFSADYLYWKIKNSPEPVPLVIKQPVSEGPFTTVLGDNKVNLGWRSGATFNLGYWLGGSQQYGSDFNYFFLSKASKTSTVSSNQNGFPPLRVPFFDVQTRSEDSSALATPGLYRGKAVLQVDNKMQGAEINVSTLLPISYSNTSINLLLGFRWWNFDEHLKCFFNSPIISPPSVFHYDDTFHVKNNFYGGQIGANFDYCYCAFNLNFKAKLALGAICQKSFINGTFTTNEFTGEKETFAAGFFALPTNSGTHKKTRFSVLPEVNVNIAYQLNESIRLKVGYTGLYVSRVLWAGKQIDRKINPSQSANINFTPSPVLVGEPSPQPRMKSEGLWAQGLNIGLEFEF